MPSPTQSVLSPLADSGLTLPSLMVCVFCTAEVDADVAQTEAAALARFGQAHENEHCTDDDQNGTYGHCAPSCALVGFLVLAIEAASPFVGCSQESIQGRRQTKRPRPLEAAKAAFRAENEAWRSRAERKT
jgi:hypothetical protein